MQFPPKIQLFTLYIVFLFVILGLACSGSRINNKYDKSGPSSIYTSAAPYKTQHISIRKEKTSIERKPIIFTEEDNITQNQVIILKVGDRYILIRIKSKEGENNE